MKTRLFAMGAALFVSAGLVACGGGGGGGGGVTPPGPSHPPATPTPTPVPTQTPNAFGCVGSTPFAASIARRPMAAPPHPIASGDTFTYAGTYSKTYAQSAPCPQPTSTTSAVVGITVTDSATTAPGGGAATDQLSAETDASPTQTTTTNTHQILQNTASQFLLFSTTSSDSISNTIATTYTNPQVLDQLPEQSGAKWGPNNPAAAIVETLADGTRISRTVASDGSYTDTETFVDGSTSSISIDGKANGKAIDGAGLYTVEGIKFSYAAPSAGNITLTITDTGSSKSRTFPAWFTVPASFISDTFVDNGAKPFDAGCTGINAGISSSGDHQIVETYTVLDPILGYTETRTTTSYVVDGFGAACVKIDDTLNSFYDYQNDTTRIDYQSENGKPNSVNHIVEFLAMSQPSTASPALRTQSERAVSPLRVAGRIAAIDHIRAVDIANRLETLHRFALQFVKKGAVR